MLWLVTDKQTNHTNVSCVCNVDNMKEDTVFVTGLDFYP